MMCEEQQRSDVSSRVGQHQQRSSLLPRLTYSQTLPHFTYPASLIMENGGAPSARDPSGFLTEISGAPVTVKLNSGVVFKGRAIPLQLDQTK